MIVTYLTAHLDDDDDEVPRYWSEGTGDPFGAPWLEKVTVCEKCYVNPFDFKLLHGCLKSMYGAPLVIHMYGLLLIKF